MAVYSDLSIDQGSDFSADIVVEDATGTVGNLSGYTVAGQIRKTYSSSTKVDFTCTVTEATAGKISIALSNTQTNAMKAGRYVYDVEITKTSNSFKTRVIEGQVTVTPGVTQQWHYKVRLQLHLVYKQRARHRGQSKLKRYCLVLVRVLQL